MFLAWSCYVQKTYQVEEDVAKRDTLGADIAKRETRSELI